MLEPLNDNRCEAPITLKNVALSGTNPTTSISKNRFNASTAQPYCCKHQSFSFRHIVEQVPCISQVATFCIHIHNGSCKYHIEIQI